MDDISNTIVSQVDGRRIVLADIADITRSHREREIIIAKAYRDAQRVKGEGDARAAGIYARSFRQDPDFYDFYRSLDAYRGTFRNKGDLLILEPDSDFFKFMQTPRGGR